MEVAAKKFIFFTIGGCGQFGECTSYNLYIQLIKIAFFDLIVSAGAQCFLCNYAKYE